MAKRSTSVGCSSASSGPATAHAPSLLRHRLIKACGPPRGFLDEALRGDAMPGRLRSSVRDQGAATSPWCAGSLGHPLGTGGRAPGQPLVKKPRRRRAFRLPAYQNPTVGGRTDGGGAG